MAGRIHLLSIFALLVPAAAAELPDLPDLPDLNVTHISRTPRYPGYVLSYERVPGSGGEAMPLVADPATGKPLSAEEAAALQRWPEVGEEVTFTATICNHGPRPSGKFTYTWYIDGNVVARGESESLDGPALMTDEVEEVEIGGQPFRLAVRRPGTYTTVALKWPWQPGRHYVRCDVDGDDRVEELCEVNNSVMDATDACSFVMMTDVYTYNHLASGKNHWNSYNFEDILKYHRDQMHRKFKTSVHPKSPRGILEEIRIDAVLVQATGERRDRIGGMAKLRAGWDSHWDFTGYAKPADPPERRDWFLTSQDWGLPHELGHQLGLVDIYAFDTEGGDGGNRVKDANGDPILLSHFSGLHGMMRGHGDRHFSEHSAVALNQQLGRRRGYFGDYLWSVPKENVVRILDAGGEPVPGAELTFYQHKHRYVEDKVVFRGTTNAAGAFALPNRDCLTFTTDNGYTIHPNPYGQINVVGTNGVFFIVVEARGRTAYVWLPLTDLNLAYWHGATERAVFDLETILPGDDAPRPVANFRQRPRDNGRVELLWAAPAGAASYTVYWRANHPPRWEVAPDGEGLTEPSYVVPRTGRYSVVAQLARGARTAFTEEQRVVLLRQPSGICLDDRGRRIVRDLGFTQPVMYQSDGSTIGIFGTFHLGLRGGGDIARTEDGRLIVSARERAPLRILDADGFPEAQVGSFGDGALQFEDPTGVTLDAAGRLWVCDTGNGRVQVLDPRFEQVVAMGGRALGLQAPMKVATLDGERYVVADREAGRLFVVRLNGAAIEKVAEVALERPVSVTGAGQRVFVACAGPDERSGGRVVAYRWADGALRPDALDLGGVTVAQPAGLVVDRKQRELLIADRAIRQLHAVSLR
jgi:hypothetical protein